MRTSFYEPLSNKMMLKSMSMPKQRYLPVKKNMPRNLRESSILDKSNSRASLMLRNNSSYMDKQSNTSGYLNQSSNIL